MADKNNTLIFLHGGGVDHNWWHPQIAALNKEFIIHAPDLPGHGQHPDTTFSIKQSLLDLESLFASKNIDQAILIGISLGGFLAIQFAERHPDKTAGLILSGSSANLNGFSGISFKLTGLFLKIKGAAWLKRVQMESFKKRLAPEILSPATKNGLFMEGAISAFGQIAGKNYHRCLQAYNHPVLLMNGAGDEPNIAQQNKLLSRLNKGEVRVLENAGHLANLEQPEAFTDEIRRFAAAVFSN